MDGNDLAAAMRSGGIAVVPDWVTRLWELKPGADENFENLWPRIWRPTSAEVRRKPDTTWKQDHGLQTAESLFSHELEWPFLGSAIPEKADDWHVRAWYTVIAKPGKRERPLIVAEYRHARAYVASARVSGDADGFAIVGSWHRDAGCLSMDAWAHAEGYTLSQVQPPELGEGARLYSGEGGYNVKTTIYKAARMEPGNPLATARKYDEYGYDE